MGWPLLFGAVGVACLIYCAAIATAAFGTFFFLIWGVMGAFCLLVAALLASERVKRAVPGWLKRTAAGLFVLGTLIFCGVEGMILTRFGAKAQPGADYCIVLGAQWKAWGPSDVLKRRLDRALEYLEANPETVAVVCGGQGANEPMAEADGMRQYLMDAGIAGERILTENRSTNTRENLEFAAELLDKENSRVVVVTNNFHVFRAVGIAKKQGYHAEGLAAGAVAWMVPNNLLREFLGVLKDFAAGNL